MSRIASLKHTGSGGTVSSRSSRNTIPRTFSGSIRMFHRGPPASGSLTLVIAADRDVIFFQDWGTFSRPQGSLSAFAKATIPKTSEMRHIQFEVQPSQLSTDHEGPRAAWD